MLFLLALSPILWLIIALGFLKMSSQKACPLALVIGLLVALCIHDMPMMNAATAVLEGVALACWPILLVIIAAIFTYNLSLHTKSMDIIKQMLTSVSHDRRVIVLLIGWGFGAFLEGMAGFGTAVAIPASMLVALGFNPVMAATVCLIANTVPTTFGSIGIPVTTLGQITGISPMLLAEYASIQLIPINLICPFLMVIITGKSIKALKGMVLITLLAGLGLVIPEIAIAFFVGPELAVMGSSIIIMGLIVIAAKIINVDHPDYRMESKSDHVELKKGFIACLPFILIFVFLLITSKLIPAINEPLNLIKTSVMIYSGEGASPYTFTWIATPGIMIFLAAFIGGKVQSASLSDMFSVLKRTVWSLRNSMITIITVIATAKVMGYSGMTFVIAETAVEVTGTMYPFIAPLIGSTGTFITGSGTSSSVLFGNVQIGAAASISANKAWLVASNAVGSAAGKMISPQTIAIAVAAIGATGKDNEILKTMIMYYIPFVIIMGCVVYFGQFFLG